LRPEDYTAQAPGRLVAADGGLAFIPNDLTLRRALNYDALVNALSDATASLGRLDGVSRQIEHPEFLFRNYLRREAVLSSAIEGTQTTVAGLVLFEASAHGDRDAKEVSSYVDALNYGLRVVDGTHAITKQLFNETHQKLMEGTEPRTTRPGMPRNCLVQLGPGTLRDARFVPPPPLFVDALLDDLVKYLADSNDPPLVKLAVAHYQFEAIHPYRDGNGRIGRLLFMLYLRSIGMLSSPLLYVSAFLERNKQQYYDLLLWISQRETWEEWIRFFLTGVAEEAADGVERTARLTALRDDYRARVAGPRKSINLIRLIDDLFDNPATSVPSARRLLGVSYPAARATIAHLQGAGILATEAVVKSGTKYWVSPGILAAIS
jgi:Fic family protein